MTVGIGSFPVKEVRFPADPRRIPLLPFRYDRLPLVMVGIAIALLPLLNPKGPANTAPVDVLLGAAILIVTVWAGTTRAQVHLPYAVPVTGLVVAGLVASLIGNAPILGGTAVIKDLFILAWCAAVTSLCRTPQALRFIVRVWCLSATAWALFLLLIEMSGQTQLPGGSGGEGGRARLWFDHPNLAGNYFMIAFFVIIASRYPRRPMLRFGALAALVAALLLTGSNSALLSLPVGALVIVFVRIHTRGGLIPALAVVLSLAIAGGAIWSVVGEPTLKTVRETDVPVLRYSVGRSFRSASAREALFSSQIELFRDSNLLGVGPSATAQNLGETGAGVAKQAHNDYLATLVERGPLGVVALLALIGAIWVRVISVQELSPSWASIIPNPAALAAGAVGFAVTALTHEVLHYRHMWVLLAVVAALHLYGRTEKRSLQPLVGAPGFHRPLERSAIQPGDR